MTRQPALALLAAGLLLCACSPGAASGDDGSPPQTAPSEVEQTRSASLGRGAGLALTCSGCHAAGGEAAKDIAGYSPDAIRTALERYKLETEGTTVMHRLARGYSEEDIAEISAYLGAEKEERP